MGEQSAKGNVPEKADAATRRSLLARLGRQVGALLSLTLILALAGLALLVWNAARSRGVVIERFEIPSGTPATAVTGEALASRVIHRLTRIRAQTRDIDRDHSLVGANPARSDWLADYRVEIPQTRVTVGDLYSGLRRLIGNDTYVGAEIYRVKPDRPDGTGIFIAVWGEQSSTRRELQAGEDEGDPLVTAAAEAIYRQTYPYLYAVYLQNQRRRPEAIALFRETAFRGADKRQRALAMNAYAADLMEEEGKCAEAIPFLQRAEALNAGLVGVQANLSNAFYCLGQDQRAFDASLREAEILRKMKEELIERRRPQLLLEHEALLAGQLGDYRRRLELYEQLELEGHGDRSIEQAMALADNYDVRGSLREYGGTVDLSVSRRPWLRFKQLWALERWAEAAAQLKSLNQLYKSWGAYVGKQVKTQNLPLVAIALAKAGGSDNIDEARSLVDDMPADCYLCIRARGIVAAAAGDHREADRQFRAALALAPRLPFAYFEWGEALFARGKVEEARRLFVKAHETGPGWADPLKAWGDARMAAGDAADAAERYASAAERAPRWGALHIEWGKALWHSGRRSEAQAKFKDAAAVGLSATNLRRALRFRCIAENSLRPAGTAEKQCPPLPG